MTVIEFLRFIAEVRGFAGAEREEPVARVLEQMDLGAVRHQRIETLSKGFKRRVGLAQAILHDPQVLILDEPTDGLDPNQKHQVRELIRGLAGEKIVIISTHILEEVDAVCNRAIIIAAGRIVADGTPLELEARSRYHRSVHIHFAADVRVVDAFAGREALAALPGVAEVETHANGRRLVRDRGAGRKSAAGGRAAGARQRLGSRRAARRARPARRSVPRHHAGGGMEQHDRHHRAARAGRAISPRRSPTCSC